MHLVSAQHFDRVIDIGPQPIPLQAGFFIVAALQIDHTDPATVPTKEMYLYASLASLGDDVYHEPSTIALEAHMAQLAGKEAALFLPSGTMSNQIALRTHLKQPPYSVLCDSRSHVHVYEAGGIGFHSGAAVYPVTPANGLIILRALFPVFSLRCRPSYDSR